MACKYQGFWRILAAVLFAVNLLLPAQDRQQLAAQVFSSSPTVASPVDGYESLGALQHRIDAMQQELDYLRGGQVHPNNNFQGIRSNGGFGEVYTYLTPRLHSHFGYGIDDPLDSTVAVTPALLGRTLNSTAYGNAIFDVTPSFRLAFEVSRRETRYRSPAVPDNEGTFFHSQVAWTF